MPRKDAASGPITAQAQQDLVSEGIENFELPKSLVTKIAKSAIPDNAKLQKETVLSLVKGSTVFINYLAATAHDVALSKQHKSISASDVLKALEMIEFGDLVEMLQGELQIYRDTSKTDKGRKNTASTSTSTTTPLNKGKSKDADALSLSTSASSSRAVKGKEKALFTTVPRAPVAVSASVHRGTDEGEGPLEMQDEVMREDGLWEDGDGTRGEEDDVEGEGEGEIDEEDEDDEDEEGEGEEEPVDMMVVEEEEVRRDAVGLDGAQGEVGQD